MSCIGGISSVKFTAQSGKQNYTVPKLKGVGGSKIVAVHYGENMVLDDSHYTINGQNVQLNFDPQDGVEINIIYKCS